MHSRALYVEQLLPKYEKMLESLEIGKIGKGVCKQNVIDVCNCLNNLVDFIAREAPSYVKLNWGADNENEFRESLEKETHIINGHSIEGSFFGIVRDIANTSKHLRIGRCNAQVRSIDKLLEGIALIRYEDNEGFYYASKATVIVQDTKDRYIPAEIPIYLTFTLVTNILISSGIIPSTPDLRQEKRNLFVTRDQSKKLTAPEIKPLAGEKGSFIFRPYIYEASNPLELRGRRAGEAFSPSLPFTLGTDKGIF